MNDNPPKQLDFTKADELRKKLIDKATAFIDRAAHIRYLLALGENESEARKLLEYLLKREQNKKEVLDLVESETQRLADKFEELKREKAHSETRSFKVWRLYSKITEILSRESEKRGTLTNLDIGELTLSAPQLDEDAIDALNSVVFNTSTHDAEHTLDEILKRMEEYREQEDYEERIRHVLDDNEACLWKLRQQLNIVKR